MTNLNPDLMNVHGGYVTYDGKFLGRFKHGASTSAKPFANFVLKNFTVEEIDALVASDPRGAPVYRAAEDRGFVLSHIKKWMKRDGFAPTRANFRAWFEFQRGKIAA